MPDSLSPLDQVKVEEWDRMIDVKIKGVLCGIAAVLPTMRGQKSSHVINLSSVAGHKVFPTAAVYCATNPAFLTNFAIAVAESLM